MSTDKSLISIGKFGATYGVRGWIKVHTYTEYGANILNYSPWLVLENESGNITTIHIVDGKQHGDGIIVKIEGYDAPETVRIFTDKTIAITRDQLPKLKKDEYYWSDLEGMTVINQRGEQLGKVIYLIETGANDVLVVKGETEIAIPYLPGKVITSIDPDKREIHVDWELI